MNRMNDSQHDSNQHDDDQRGDAPITVSSRPQPSSEDVRQGQRAIRIILIIAILFILMAGAGIWMAARSGLAALSQTKTAVVDIARAFSSGTITETFLQHNVEVSPTGGDVLEVAVLKNDEVFRRTQSRRIAWDLVSLGTTVSEIRVPVTYRYHVKISDFRRLDVRGQTCVVVAPPIRPSLPPALHVDRLERHTESGWALFDKAENLEKLESGLMKAVQRRAETNVHLVREQCRRGVAEFVRNWLLREDHWRADRFSAIIVLFPDELDASSAGGALEIDGHDTTLRLN